MDIKIDHEEMKRLYKAFVSEQAPNTRKECPTPEQLISLLSTNDEKKEMIDHITQCSFCTKEIRVILQALKEGERFSKEIMTLVKSGGKEEKKKRFSFFYPHFPWVFVSSMIAITAVFIIFITKFPHKHISRGKSHNMVELVSPAVEKILIPPIIFKWQTSGNAEYFIMEIFDETLYPIWKSDQITNYWLIFPNETLKLFTPKKKYFWMITAHFQDGTVIESPLKEFILK